jgi:hypothetical protein
MADGSGDEVKAAPVGPGLARRFHGKGLATDGHR